VTQRGSDLRALQPKCSRLIGNRGRWIHFRDKFATRSRINVPTAHAQTSLWRKSPKMVSRCGS